MKNTATLNVQVKANGSNKRKSSRVHRACYNCRKRKQGCDEERPCKRCADKGVDCLEAETKRMRRSHHHHAPHPREDEDTDVLDELSTSFSSSSEEVESSSSSEIMTSAPHRRQQPQRPSPLAPLVSQQPQGPPPHHTSPAENHAADPSMHLVSRVLSKESVLSAPIASSHTVVPLASALPQSPKRGPAKRDTTHKAAHQREDHKKRSQKLDRRHAGEHASSSLHTPFPLEAVSYEQVRQRFSQESDPKATPFMTTAFSQPMEVETASNAVFLDSGLQPAQLPVFFGNLVQANNASAPVTAKNLSLGLLLPFLNNPSLDALTGEYDLDYPFYVSPPASPHSDELSEDDFSDGDPILDHFVSFLDQAKACVSFKSEFHKAKQLWKDIMCSLRTLDWQRVQTCLQEMDSVQADFLQGGKQAPPAVLFWSPGGRIHHANESFCRLVGYSVDELRVKHSHTDTVEAHSLFHPGEMVKLFKKQLDAIQNPELPSSSFYIMKTCLLSKWRQEIPVSCSISNLRDTMGVPLLTSMIIFQE